MGIDKWKAKNFRYRIPEKTLLLIAILGGSIGSFIGMQIFRHKTKHARFAIGIPAIILIQVAIIVYIVIKY